MSVARERPRTVLTLVHGTWARNSRWPELEAVIADVLPKPLQVNYFQWPHWNSVIGRHRASVALADSLREQFESYPDCHHCVIGHSHGGNVAMKALAAPDLQARVDSVVCLSTPFLIAEPQRFSERLVQFVALMIAVFTPGVVQDTEAGRRFLVAHPDLASGLFLAWLGLLIWMVWVADRTKPELLRALQQPPLEGLYAKSLILRLPADEASLALALTQAAGGVGSAAWTAIYKLIAFDLPGLARAGWLIFLPVVIVITKAWMLLVLVLCLVWPITALLLFPFGGVGLMLHGPSLLISVESTPPGAWTVVQAVPISQGLRHSLTYKAPEALEQIRGWLASRVGAAV
jgi:predicted alpha/beta-hydrolase family hydrolase